jgi:EEF1A lysine methyltransferase 4
MPNKSAKILHLGCGNSTLAEELYKSGYNCITNVDYSQKVIKYMKERTMDMKEMKWIVGDIFELEKCFNLLASFDIAIDKGTLDALLTVKHDPWNPHQELLDQIHAYVQQVLLQLKKGGSFLHITFAQPHFRKRFLDIPEFEVKVHKLGTGNGGFEYFCYEAIKL